MPWQTTIPLIYNAYAEQNHTPAIKLTDYSRRVFVHLESWAIKVTASLGFIDILSLRTMRKTIEYSSLEKGVDTVNANRQIEKVG